MDYLYSLYDALVSINVPNDKARAVIDAMERDMATTLATKADLENLRVTTRSELQLLRQELTFAIATAVSSLATREDVQAIRDDVLDLRQDSDLTRKDIVLIRSEMDMLSTRITLRVSSVVGAIVVAGLGLLLAVLRLG